MKSRVVHQLDIFNFIKIVWAFWMFSERLKTEEHLLPKSALDLMLQMFRGLSVVKMLGWRIVGHVTLWDLETGWYELGTLWVDPAMRKHGVGEEIMSRLLSQRKDLCILMTTTNPIVKAMSVQLGLRKKSFFDLEPRVHASTCVCSFAKTRSEDFRRCVQKDGHCSLFVNTN